MTERKTVTREELAAALVNVTRRYLYPGDKGYEAWLNKTTDAIFAALPESADKGLRTALLGLHKQYGDPVREDSLMDLTWDGKPTPRDPNHVYVDGWDDALNAVAALAATLPEPGEGS